MIKYLLIGLLIIMIAIWLYREDFLLSRDLFTVENRKIPEEFTGFRIAQISDFHNNHNRQLNDSIIASLREEKPDIIVITGDLFDKRRTDIEAARSFAEKLSDIAPVYYVSGNHEGKKPEQFIQLISKLEGNNITVLRDSSAKLIRNGSMITLTGIDSPHFVTENRQIRKVIPVIERKLSGLNKDSNQFNILLAHHPEYFSVYSQYGYDLILSGHAHGGQIRLPGIGGLFAPSQGAVPKYTAGEYLMNDSLMIVSRGIDNSLFPFRINNRPDLVYIDLKKNKKCRSH